MKEHITHHYACDCREAKFAEIEAENKKLREALERASRIVEKYKDACFEWAKESHHKGNTPNRIFWEKRTKSMANLLIEIKQALTDIPEQSPWINVEDRLPEKPKKNEDYFFKEKYGSYQARTLFNSTYDMIKGDLRDMFTHWMKIPELPKENK